MPSPVPTVRPSSSQIALTNLTIVDVSSGTTQADRSIVLDGDRIVAVVAAASVPGGSARTIDMRGKYVIPGLWDMHVHFDTKLFAKLFVANGVTGVRVMWGNPPGDPGTERLHFELRDAFDKKKAVGPRMVIASQLLDGPKPFWENSVALSNAAQGRKAVDDAKASGVDFIKVYSFLPRDVYFAIADESRQQGLPFAGHVPDAITVAEASDAGQKSIEHLTGMQVACSSRETELRNRQRDFAKKERSSAEWSKFGQTLSADAMASYDADHAGALFAKFVANGTWHCPTLTVNHAFATRDDPSHASDPRMQYMPRWAKEAWNPKQDLHTKARPPADYAALRARFDNELALVGAMSKAGVPLLAGTDEPNPYCFAGFSLHDELEWLVKAGLSPVEALRAATSGPARFLGQEATMGAVAAGKLADLVILDGDPLVDIGNTRKIAAVVSRGVLHDRAALDKMLEDTKYAAAHPQ